MSWFGLSHLFIVCISPFLLFIYCVGLYSALCLTDKVWVRVIVMMVMMVVGGGAGVV